MEKDNVCIDCYNHVDKVAKVLNLGQPELDILTIPKRILTFSFPVKLDSGDIRYFTGYRVNLMMLAALQKEAYAFTLKLILRRLKYLPFL